MRTNKKTAAAVAGLVGYAIAAGGCDVTQTREGRAPEVDVSAEPGRWPQYDVDWATVKVGTEQRTITVPTVRVVEEQREITVPYLDIDPPGARDREERTIAMELEAPHSGYQLSITEIRAAGDDLWVIGELVETATPADRAATRVSDQVVVNAPSDLDVRKVVIGERHSGNYNRQYAFFDTMAALETAIPDGARVLYQRTRSATQ